MESAPFIFPRIEFFLFILVWIGLLFVLGNYIVWVFSDQPTSGNCLAGRIECFFYRMSGLDPQVEMTWTEYLQSVVLFNLLGFLFLFFLLLFQGNLFWNPQQFPGLPWPLAFNIATSFVTNTNWQSYAGETSLSYLSQMLGLTTQNFLSAAVGMAALLVLMRGIVRKSAATIGNFWRDLVRSVVYLFLPLSIFLALLLVSQGVVQTLSPYREVHTLESGKAQTIPLGPAASQVAIKQLGTNGGGFFNANSAHPFENPTPCSNFLETLAILLVPGAAVQAYGVWIGNRKHAGLLLAIMFLFWIVGIVASLFSENLPNPVIGVYPSMEGKEVRFGGFETLLWAVSTTGTSNGSVNGMLSSLSPLAGGIALFNIMLGEFIFGGVGVGLCSMIFFVLLTVFMSGLMVGRTPEYLGKKIEKREIQWIMAAILAPGALILIGAGISAIYPGALSSLSHSGPHGLSEILYAFSSAAGNNGSAFAGLNANTDYYNISLGIVMWISRLVILSASIAVGGLLARKKYIPPSSGTFSTETGLFFILLVGIIFIAGALTFFPALSLGPILELLLVLEGRAV